MVSEENDLEHKLGLKEKCVDLYNKFKFPVTIEPIVFFFTLSVGLNEVDLKTFNDFTIEKKLSDNPT